MSLLRERKLFVGGDTTHLYGALVVTVVLLTVVLLTVVVTVVTVVVVVVVTVVVVPVVVVTDKTAFLKASSSVFSSSSLCTVSLRLLTVLPKSLRLATVLLISLNASQIASWSAVCLTSVAPTSISSPTDWATVKTSFATTGPRSCTAFPAAGAMVKSPLAATLTEEMVASDATIETTAKM